MLINVTDVEVLSAKSTGKTYYRITDKAGIKRLSFIGPPAAGCTVEADVVPTKDGRGEVIQSWKVVQPVLPAAQVGASATGANAPQTELKKTGSGTMSREDWAERERITRQSIHRQSASDRAVSLVVAGKVPIENLSVWTEVFANYYETGTWGPFYAILSSASLPAKSAPIEFSIPESPNPVDIHVQSRQVKEFAMCPIHKTPLDKKTKDGAPAHEFIDETGARHKCIPKVS